MKALKPIPTYSDDEIAKEEIKELMDSYYQSKVEELLLKCTAKTEYEAYGDTYVVSGNYYDDRDVEECQKEARLEIKAEFLVNPIGFINDYIGDEEFFKPHLVLGIINNLK